MFFFLLSAVLENTTGHGNRMEQLLLHILMFVVKGVTKVLNFDVMGNEGEKISYLHSLPCFLIFEVHKRN